MVEREITPPEKVSILGVKVSRVNYQRAIELIIRAAKKRESFGVTALAVHGIMEGFMDPGLAAEINRLNIVTPDGQPVSWALNLLGAKEIKSRVSGPNLMLRVCERAAKEDLPIFLFGSRQEVLEKVSFNLLTKYPKLKLAGMQADRFREATPEEDARDVKTVNQSGARIVFVGRGCPRQERWVANQLGSIHAPMLAVGAAFDFHAQIAKQAPEFLQDIGLAWFHRLLHEPRRLWYRYLVLNQLFLYHFSKQLLKECKHNRLIHKN
jgi:exopolysaccharide biosynthesis WecB/TagA/CpsF family protein